jgi:hypothetical protein
MPGLRIAYIIMVPATAGGAGLLDARGAPISSCSIPRPGMRSRRKRRRSLCLRRVFPGTGNHSAFNPKRITEFRLARNAGQGGMRGGDAHAPDRFFIELLTFYYRKKS